jgi:hypothetical protein
MVRSLPRKNALATEDKIEDASEKQGIRRQKAAPKSETKSSRKYRMHGIRPHAECANILPISQRG